MKEKDLLTIERRIWAERQKAFQRYNSGQYAGEYDKGLQWGVVSNFDHILSIFRDVIDGTPGSGHEQMAAQAARCAK